MSGHQPIEVPVSRRRTRLIRECRWQAVGFIRPDAEVVSGNSSVGYNNCNIIANYGCRER